MSLYQEIILDHYRNPRNQGALEHASHHGAALNPTCGDSLQMDIEVKNDTIEDVRFQGSGCAISQASASLLTEAIKGKSLAEAFGLSPEDVVKMVGVPLSPNRMKCSLLSLETLKKTLNHNH